MAGNVSMPNIPLHTSVTTIFSNQAIGKWFPLSEYANNW